MKVIQPGRSQQGYSVEATCTGKGNGGGGCGAELLIEEADLFRTERGCMGKEIDYFTTFKCSECGVLTDIQTPINPQSLPHYTTWKKKQKKLMSKSPLAFFIAGTSKIKLNALQAAVNHADECYASISPIAGAESLINEQPVGFRETLTGAINRVLTAQSEDPRGDIYFSVENGIDCADKDEISPGSHSTETWTDFAIVLAYIFQGEKSGQIHYIKSESVIFPTNAVEATRQKQGGFVENTVGKTLQEMGIVQNHADPHVDLGGKSRQQILQEAFEELLTKLPKD